MANARSTRRAPQGLNDVSYTLPDGTTKTIHAKGGKISAPDATADAVLDSFGFTPVATASKPKAASKPRSTKRRAAKKEAPARPPEEVRDVSAPPDEEEA